MTTDKHAALTDVADASTAGVTDSANRGVATISTTVVFADDPHALRRLLEALAARPTLTAPATRRPATSGKA